MNELKALKASRFYLFGPFRLNPEQGCFCALAM
jgi:hypothetical protein